MERKFIIVKRSGKIKHFIFPYSMHHYTFAYDNGYKTADVIETGLIAEYGVKILDCSDSRHSEKRFYKRQLSFASLQAREAQTRYTYGIQREGD
jgi:hypothetical protein